MGAQLRLLDSDGVSPFVSHNYGNVLAGAQSVPKLVFVNSYGDVAAEECEFGVEAVAGNDGYLFTEFCSANEINAVALTVTGVVGTSGGSIAAGASIQYKVAVADRWGNESEPCPSAYSPTFSTGTTNKVDLSWAAVAGAFKYVVYANVNGTGYYKLGETPTNSFSDLTGANDGTTVPRGAGSVAYVEGTWQTTPIDFATLAIGAKRPVTIRENVPLGITSSGNPRQHKCYVAFLAT